MFGVKKKMTTTKPSNLFPPELKVIKVSNLFDDQEIEDINKAIDAAPKHSLRPIDWLGGLAIDELNIPSYIVNKVTDFVVDTYNLKVKPTMIYPPPYVEYSNTYGDPLLMPHFDGDTIDLIVDYQLASNTDWNIGVDLKSYKLEDNSAVLFNPNKNIHWRPHKTFKNGEYVRMIFFRFYDPVNTSDYSNLPLPETNNSVFKEARKIRDAQLEERRESGSELYD